jgi:hypothetical protein
MFDQQNGQDNQQQNFQDVNAPGQPAAPANDQVTDAQQAPAPQNQQFSAPKPAYESIFDEDSAAVTNDGSLSSDDQASATTPQTAEPTTPPTPTAPVATSADDSQLLDIKKQALEHLSPLVGQLEQNPEEKFHTTMRIIQASDNHGLIKDAYEAAQNIKDDKVRAQALLDIVNEINYFTKEPGQEVDQPDLS